jgi:glyoxylase-like metal-dependent hydrolase (beta-lactamase superfamily II)
MQGSKTPGELALVLDDTTLITGDLIRSHRAGQLTLLLPEQGLADRAQALASVAALAQLPRLEAVLVGDGWSVFRDGRARLAELAAR